MSDGQVHPFNKSGVESSRETQSLQVGRESGLCSKPHHVRDPHQLASPVAFFHLVVDQTRRHLYGLPSSWLSPTFDDVDGSERPSFLRGSFTTLNAL